MIRPGGRRDDGIFKNNWKKFSVTGEMENENLKRKLESHSKGSQRPYRESGVEDIPARKSYDQSAF